MIDLHLHSTVSDGSETPEELVIHGCRVGLKAMALTDHDSLDGVEAFLAACRAHGMTGLAAVELSAAVGEEKGSLHILGYGVDPNHPQVSERLGRVRAGRDRRNHEILARLVGLGFALEWPAVEQASGGDVVGRVHIAQAMVARGYVASIAEAFERFLARGRPAYANRYRLAPEEAIGMIRAAGGAAVVAHPFSWEQDEAKLEAGLRGLKELGLAGIEAYHSDYGAETTIALLRLAKRLGVWVTGGSDYHGKAKPNLQMGKGYGSLCVPDEVLPPLLQALGADTPWVAKEDGKAVRL